MGNTKTFIELNGKKYDATTGRVIGESTHSAHPTQAKTAPKPVSGKNMDGFFKKSSVAHPARQAKPSVHAHKPQKPQTLMRHVVKKPATQPKQKPAAVAATPTIAAPTTVLNEKIHRANKVHKSPLISRFGGALKPNINKKVAPLSVKPAPNEPPIEAKAHQKQSKAEQMLQAALHNADARPVPKSHKQKRRERVAKKLGVSTRFVSLAAGSLAVIILAGFIAYQNVPNFAMRIADARAGFNAGMPGYKPSGFSMRGPIQVSPGQVTINFRSNSDQRTFAVNQKPSTWTSESLLNNYVATKNTGYTTYQDKGRTIYIYNGSNATWVNGGVWYTIEGDSSLNTDQLLNIANSF